MKLRIFLIAAAMSAVAVVLSGCGNDSAKESGSDSPRSTGKQVDAMFVRGMVPHHQAAIDMAQLGVTDAKRPEIKELSENIMSSQQAEIEQLNELAKELPAGKDSMMSKRENTNMMMMADNLKEAKDFDKAFIDSMIPHHQSAIVMARKAISGGSNPEVKKIAKAIVAAQTKEIAAMQSWRTDWYGSPLPTGSSSSMGSSAMHGTGH